MSSFSFRFTFFTLGPLNRADSQHPDPFLRRLSVERRRMTSFCPGIPVQRNLSPNCWIASCDRTALKYPQQIAHKRSPLRLIFLLLLLLTLLCAGHFARQKSQSECVLVHFAFASLLGVTANRR